MRLPADPGNWLERHALAAIEARDKAWLGYEAAYELDDREQLVPAALTKFGKYMKAEQIASAVCRHTRTPYKSII